jgi:hypothetical protein
MVVGHPFANKRKFAPRLLGRNSVLSENKETPDTGNSYFFSVQKINIFLPKSD